LLSSASSLPSSADTSAEGLTITALVRDAANRLMSGVNVNFNASLGALQIVNATTDETGAATAILTTGGDPQNQDIAITAIAGSASRSIAIPVTGTRIDVTGPQTIGSGDRETFVATLLDAASGPIPNQPTTVTSLDLGNPINFANNRSTTDADGKIQFEYAGASGGSDRIEVSSVGVTSLTGVVVSDLKLEFQSPSPPPAPRPEVLFSTAFDTQVTIRLTENSQSVRNRAITFAITRGLLRNAAGVEGQTVSTSTDTNGRATVSIRASGAGSAGGAVISATAGSGVSANLPIEFVATTPAKVALQADPSVVPVNGTGTIRAVVRDANNNLVKNQRVNFALSDPTGGSLSAAFAITDSLGSASVTYSATATSSPIGGVEVTGTINGTAISAVTTLTVGNQALRILLGTGNEIGEPTPTTYTMPWVAIVTDAAGNPPPENTVFRVSVEPVSYQKGIYVLSEDDNWVAIYSIDPTVESPSPLLPQPPLFGCINEDIPGNGIDGRRGNGVLDPGEDFNFNGILDPGGVGVVQGSPTLNDDGTAFFDITYPQTHGNWVQMRLRAEAVVAGTESLEIADFVLPVLAADVIDEDVSPPGFPYGTSVGSPYGTSSSCASTN